MKEEDLETGERFIWNWRSKKGRASDFYRALVRLMKRADPTNMARIRAGFPEEAEAYLQYRLTPGWWDDLEAKMEA